MQVAVRIADGLERRKLRKVVAHLREQHLINDGEADQETDRRSKCKDEVDRVAPQYVGFLALDVLALGQDEQVRSQRL